MKNQLVILAAGDSSRFFPFNGVHKSLFQIAGKPLLKHTLDNVGKLKDFEVILVLGRKNQKVEREILENMSIGNGVRIIYQKNSLGQGDGILTAKELIKGNFFVINAQQFNFNSQKYFLDLQRTQNIYSAVVGALKTEEPWKYGVLNLDNDKVLGIVEKPERGKEPSNIRISGIYYFSKGFLGELEKTKISDYSLEETLDRLAGLGKVGKVDLDQETPSIKYPWDLLKVKNYFLGGLKRNIYEKSQISPSATIRGEVYIGKGAMVYDCAVIDGPAYIGDDAVVGAYCHIRGGSVIEKNAELQHYVDFKNSVIGEHSTIHSGFIGDSIIGKNVKIGAGFITANKRLDRENVRVLVKGVKVDSNLRGLGLIIGDNTKLGICVTAMPGTVVGENSTVYPNAKLSGTYQNNQKIK